MRSASNKTLAMATATLVVQFGPAPETAYDIEFGQRQFDFAIRHASIVRLLEPIGVVEYKGSFELRARVEYK